MLPSAGEDRRKPERGRKPRDLREVRDVRRNLEHLHRLAASQGRLAEERGPLLPGTAGAEHVEREPERRRRGAAGVRERGREAEVDGIEDGAFHETI
jgi:hypothetical protein